MKNIPKYADHLEEMVGRALFDAGIKFIHDSQGGGQRLDFFLPKHDIYIEIKQYHSDRISEQLMLRNNIIVLQGINSVKCFVSLLNTYNEPL